MNDWRGAGWIGLRLRMWTGMALMACAVLGPRVAGVAVAAELRTGLNSGGSGAERGTGEGAWVVLPTTPTASATSMESAKPVLTSEPASLAAFEGGANFFPAARGLYNGLIAPTDEVVPERSGYFRINVSSYGAFSGHFSVGGDTVPIRGWFNSRGLAGVSIYRRVWDDCHCFRELILAWTVELDLVAGSDEIEGTVVNERHGGWRVDLYGLKAGYVGAADRAPQEGRYTLRLPGSVDAVVAPPGDGYAAVTVKAKGVARISGALPEGTKISDDAYLSTDGYWPVYVPLNDGHGIVFGWLRFNGSDLEGNLSWQKPARSDRSFYPEGFAGSIHARGGSYALAPGASSPFSWTLGQLRAFDGNLSGVLENEVHFTSSHSVADRGGDMEGLKLKVDAKKGLFSGSFLHPASGRRTSFAGALFQFEDAGGGYFLGIDQGGTVAWVGAGSSR